MTKRISTLTSSSAATLSENLPVALSGLSAAATTTPSVTGVPNSAADAAVNGSVARKNYGNLTGAGIKIGIISDSLDAPLNSDGTPASTAVQAAIPAPAVEAATAGYISPYLTSATGSAPEVVDLSPTATGSDEGLEMAELVYETAPGAQVFFASGNGGEAGIAAAIGSLQAVGCQIIVSDISYPTEPFFFQNSIVDTAVENYINKGNNYFDAAGNEGSYFYQGIFNPIAGILSVPAMNFGGGNVYERVTITSNVTIKLELQWNQPFGASQYSLAIYLYDSSHNLIISNTVNQVGGDPVQTLDIQPPGNVSATPTDYYIAIGLNGGTLSASPLFRFIFVGAPTNSITIHDPNAGIGSLRGDQFGQALVPGVDVVGATNVANTAVVDPYSDAGAVSYLAPDGSTVNVGVPSTFIGTSAAAPVAAAVAALMLQANKQLTNAQVTRYLTESGIPVAASNPAGVLNTGGGLIQADAALGLATGNFQVTSIQELLEAFSAIAVDSKYQSRTYKITPGGALSFLADPSVTLSNNSTIDIEGQGYGIDLGGADLNFTGGNVIINDATLTDGYLISNASSISLSDSDVSLTTLSGSGVISIGSTSTVSVSGTIEAGTDIQFDGTNSVLQINDPQQDYGTIDGFAAGNTIDVVGVGTAASALDQGDTLEVETSTGETLSLPDTVVSDGSDRSLVESDGAGGIDIINTGGGFTSSPGEYLVAPNIFAFSTLTYFIPSDTLDLADFGSPVATAVDDYASVEPSYVELNILLETQNFSFSIENSTVPVNTESFLVAPDGAHGTDITAYSDNQTIAFNGTNEVLMIVDAANFTGTIENIRAGDAIYFGDVYSVGTISSSNKISAYGNYIQLDPSENFSNLGVLVSSQSFGPILEFLPAPAGATGSRTVTATTSASTSSVTFSATNIQFSAVRDGEFGQSVPITVTYAGGQESIIHELGANQNLESVFVGPTNTTATLDVKDYPLYTSELSSSPFKLPVLVEDDSGGNSSNGQTVDITGTIPEYGIAQASFEIGGTAASSYDLGVLHLGDTKSVILTVANGATGDLTDTLSSSVGSIGEFTAANALTDISAGQSGTVTVTFAADSTGEASAGPSLFDFISHDSALPDVTAQVATLDLTAEVYSYAQAELFITNGPSASSSGVLIQNSSDSWALDLGTLAPSLNTLHLPTSVGVVNMAQGSLIDRLGGSFSTSGSGFVDSLDPSSELSRTGATTLSFSPDLSNTGTFTQVVTFHPTSIDSGGTTALQPITLTVTDDVACFGQGTRLSGFRGEVRVESLHVGDVLRTSTGGLAAIKWLGHRRLDCRRHPHPHDVWPVRIAAGAFGPGLPTRSLFLSPDHAVFAEGVLIPVKYLINGATIAQQPLDEVTYWHVELERHDVILAEGLPCETYLDSGNRRSFANAGGAMQRHPDFVRAGGGAIWEAASCAPLRIEGEAVARVVARLRQRAKVAGHRPPTGLRRRARGVAPCDLARLLQPGWYLAENPDVAASGLDAARHYAGWGRAEGRLPCAEVELIRLLGLVDPGLLVFTMADVVAAGFDPVAHFCRTGWRERRQPNPYFDTSWYLDTHASPAGMNPLLHYVLTGERLPPGPHFDPVWYRRRYALPATISPLAHYLVHRRGQRVSPLPSFDVAAYVKAHAETLRPGRDAYAHYLAIGRFEADTVQVDRAAA